MLTNICLVSSVPLTIQKNAYATIFSNSAQREVFRTGILSHQKRTCWPDSGAVLLLFIFALYICSLFFTFNLFLKIVCFCTLFFPSIVSKHVPALCLHGVQCINYQSFLKNRISLTEQLYTKFQRLSRKVTSKSIYTR